MISLSINKLSLFAVLIVCAYRAKNSFFNLVNNPEFADKELVVRYESYGNSAGIINPFTGSYSSKSYKVSTDLASLLFNTLTCIGAASMATSYCNTSVSKMVAGALLAEISHGLSHYYLGSTEIGHKLQVLDNSKNSNRPPMCLTNTAIILQDLPTVTFAKQVCSRIGQALFSAKP